MKKLAVIFAITVLGLVVSQSSLCAAADQGVTGDWKGTLHAGPAELRIALHISKAADGTLTATMDSADQYAYGIPVSSIEVRDSKLKFEVVELHGTYEGTIKDGGSRISGTWSQGQPLPLNFERGTFVAAKPAAPTDIDGAWMGSLNTGGVSLRIVFHLINTSDGLAATMDSPDQGGSGLPATAVSRNGASIRIEVETIHGVFAGQISKDLTSITGTWTQLGNSFPLVLQRVKNAAQLERRRPQNPTKPYPYREEEVSYDSRAPGVRLVGTLTIPTGKGPFPAVLLIAGSGSHDRDESLFGHKPFLVLSDYLTRKGISVPRADKRGVAESTGDISEATTADFAADAEAGITYLKSRPEINPNKIGLIGHSEGGAIAPLVAARDADVAFIVLMAAPGVRGDELLREQEMLIWQAGGMSHEAAERKADQNWALIQLVEQEKDDTAPETELRQRLTGEVPEAQIDTQVKTLTSPWFRYFMSYDPNPTLRTVKCPVLALNGEKDLQVPPAQNLPAIRKALQEGGNQHFDIVELPGLNHLFQTAQTGAPAEYGQIQETMSPVAMNTIATWILKQ